jgi:carboxylate-amine ligase
MFADTAFTRSLNFTIGAEIEYQILDCETGQLAPGALRILNACEQEQLAGISGEFLLSMIEVKSDVCHDVEELQRNLLPRLKRLRNIAASLGYDLAMGGTHPVAKPCMAAIYPEERYQKILTQQGWMAYQEAIFGLHFHVGVPDGDAAIRALNHSVPYLPHLLSLSANSPFWQGIDTDYTSSRMRMFRPSACAGVPPYFSSWQALCDYADVMHSAGLLESTKDMYWDIRPQPKYGTIEFRIFDVPANLDVVWGLAALTRALVVQSLNHDQGSQIGQPEFWLANENKWKATRFGLETECQRTVNGERKTLATDLLDLLSTLEPIAKEMGDRKFLRVFGSLHDFETGAQRQRRFYREHGTWQAVVNDMRTTWTAGLSDVLDPPTFQALGSEVPTALFVGTPFSSHLHTGNSSQF